MPKDEFDFDDPLELNGVAFCTEEDTSHDMAVCFAEEFMRMGYNHKQVLALFRNPHYVGMNMVLQNKGEPFVREVISEVFACWGKEVQWPAADCKARARSEAPPFRHAEDGSRQNGDQPADGKDLVDPMGNPIPRIE